MENNCIISFIILYILDFVFKWILICFTIILLKKVTF